MTILMPSLLWTRSFVGEQSLSYGIGRRPILPDNVHSDLAARWGEVLRNPHVEIVNYVVGVAVPEARLEVKVVGMTLIVEDPEVPPELRDLAQRFSGDASDVYLPLTGPFPDLEDRYHERVADLHHLHLHGKEGKLVRRVVIEPAHRGHVSRTEVAS